MHVNPCGDGSMPWAGWALIMVEAVFAAFGSVIAQRARLPLIVRDCVRADRSSGSSLPRAGDCLGSGTHGADPVADPSMVMLAIPVILLQLNRPRYRAASL